MIFWGKVRWARPFQVEAKAAEGVPEGGLAKAQAAATAAAAEAAKLGLSPEAQCK